MKTFLEKVVVVAGVAALSIFSLTATAEIKVVANATNHASVSIDDIADVYLGKLNTLPGGVKVVPFDQAEEVKNEFYKKVAKRDPAQLKAYWSRLIFTGKGQPPKELGSDAEVIRYVASNPEAIGYVSGNTPAKGVNVLLIVP